MLPPISVCLIAWPPGEGFVALEMALSGD